MCICLIFRLEKDACTNSVEFLDMHRRDIELIYFDWIFMFYEKFANAENLRFKRKRACHPKIRTDDRLVDARKYQFDRHAIHSYNT